MPFSIPDKGEGQNDIQSILFQEQLDILVAGISGTDCVLSGCAVTAQGAPDMTVAVAKGAILSNRVLFAVAAANGTITAANATNPRLDLVVITSAGAIAVRAGTAAAAPKPPARTANDVALALVYVPANDTTIGSDQITDMKVTPHLPCIIKKATTAVVTNTTAAAFDVFTITLPNGLFVAGKILRVRVGGNYLFNSGTPTVTISIAYGGTTLWAFTSAAATADADRGAWRFDLDLISQANADQSLVGLSTWTITSARTAPTTGIGAGAGTGVNTPSAVLSGSSAADSDTADRILSMQFTMSVSNVANEIVVEYATAELLG